MKFYDRIKQYFISKKELQNQLDLANANLHVAYVLTNTQKTEIEKLKSDAVLVYRSDWSIEDPSPVDTDSREAYVSQSIAFFANFGTAKIQQLIARAYADLANPLNTRDYDLQIKGCINALSQMLDWRDELEAEQAQIQQDTLNNNNNN